VTLATIIELDVNNAGHPFIGACDYDVETELGVRAYVLSGSSGNVHPRIMRKRFEDMQRLMAGNVSEFVVTAAFLTAEAAAPAVLPPPA
jgi:hypothetical protein